MCFTILDDFVPKGLLAAASATWPELHWGHWHKYGSGKLVSKSPEHLPRACRAILDGLAAIDAASELEIGPLANIFPDIEYLHGAGMHQLNAGDDLGLHLDTERHPTLPWKREISAVLYLDDYSKGGELDLTDSAGNIFKRIEPKVNRLVLFTTPAQWHRVNACTSRRRSLCLFFWSICDDSFVGDEHACFA